MKRIVKKLRVDEVDVKTVEARCDWCGEEKPCYQSTKPIKFSYFEDETELGTVIDGWEYSFWGKKVIKGGWRFREVVENREFKTAKKYAHICGECTEQLPNPFVEDNKSNNKGE